MLFSPNTLRNLKKKHFENLCHHYFLQNIQVVLSASIIIMHSFMYHVLGASFLFLARIFDIWKKKQSFKHSSVFYMKFAQLQDAVYVHLEPSWREVGIGVSAVCACVRACGCVCACVCGWVGVGVCIYVCMYVRTYVCMCVVLCVCVCVCVCGNTKEVSSSLRRKSEYSNFRTKN